MTLGVYRLLYNFIPFTALLQIYSIFVFNFRSLVHIKFLFCHLLLNIFAYFDVFSILREYLGIFNSMFYRIFWKFLLVVELFSLHVICYDGDSSFAIKYKSDIFTATQCRCWPWQEAILGKKFKFKFLAGIFFGTFF